MLFLGFLRLQRSGSHILPTVCLDFLSTWRILESNNNIFDVVFRSQELLWNRNSIIGIQYRNKGTNRQQEKCDNKIFLTTLKTYKNLHIKQRMQFIKNQMEQKVQNTQIKNAIKETHCQDDCFFRQKYLQILLGVHIVVYCCCCCCCCRRSCCCCFVVVVLLLLLLLLYLMLLLLLLLLLLYFRKQSSNCHKCIQP